MSNQNVHCIILLCPHAHQHSWFYTLWTEHLILNKFSNEIKDYNSAYQQTEEVNISRHKLSKYIFEVRNCWRFRLYTIYRHFQHTLSILIRIWSVNETCQWCLQNSHFNKYFCFVSIIRCFNLKNWIESNFHRWN